MSNRSDRLDSDMMSLTQTELTALVYGLNIIKSGGPSMTGVDLTKPIEYLVSYLNSIRSLESRQSKSKEV